MEQVCFGGVIIRRWLRIREMRFSGKRSVAGRLGNLSEFHHFKRNTVGSVWFHLSITFSFGGLHEHEIQNKTQKGPEITGPTIADSI